MRGFSMPSISIPNVSIPNISISNNVDVGTIKSAITSALPDLSDLTSGLNIEGKAEEMLSDAMSGSIELPSELSDLLK